MAVQYRKELRNVSGENVSRVTYLSYICIYCNAIEKKDKNIKRNEKKQIGNTLN